MRFTGSDSDGEASPEYDSRILRPKDAYTLTPIVPGSYRVINKLTQATAILEVAAPAQSRGRHIAPPAARIACGEEGFAPARVEMTMGQTAVFVPTVASRISVEIQNEETQ